MATTTTGKPLNPTQRRRSNPTPKKRRAFLANLARTGNVSISANAENLSRRELYRLRNEDEAFAAEWTDALLEAADHLEAEARRRAVDGWDEPIHYQGVEVGRVRRFSDTLLIFLLKAANPEKYRDRVSQELTGPGGQPLLPGAVQIYIPSNGRDELDALAVSAHSPVAPPPIVYPLD